MKHPSQPTSPAQAPEPDPRPVVWVVVDKPSGSHWHRFDALPDDDRANVLASLLAPGESIVVD